MLYNIYAGLSGSFGGASYLYTHDYNSEIEAIDAAYQEAVYLYDEMANIYDIPSYDDCLSLTESEEEAEDMYNEEIENWIDYYVVVTDNDTETSKEEIWMN